MEPVNLLKVIVIILTIIAIEIIYLFDFLTLSPSYQSYGVNQTSMIFAINNTGTVNFTGLTGIVGNILVKGDADFV